MCNQRGIIWTITGDGKGKTTAAFGQALRALGHNQAVAIIQFLKGSNIYGEYRFLQQLANKQLLIKQVGLPTFVRKNIADQIDQDLVLRGWFLARSLIETTYNLVILDEINVALDYGLLAIEDVIKTLTTRPATVSIILTGRNAPQEILAISDTVSIITNGKHHYEQGLMAQAGIEF